MRPRSSGGFEDLDLGAEPHQLVVGDVEGLDGQVGDDPALLVGFGGGLQGAMGRGRIDGVPQPARPAGVSRIRTVSCSSVSTNCADRSAQKERRSKDSSRSKVRPVGSTAVTRSTR